MFVHIRKWISSEQHNPMNVYLMSWQSNVSISNNISILNIHYDSIVIVVILFDLLHTVCSVFAVLYLDLRKPQRKKEAFNHLFIIKPHTISESHTASLIWIYKRRLTVMLEQVSLFTRRLSDTLRSKRSMTIDSPNKRILLVLCAQVCC